MATHRNARTNSFLGTLSALAVATATGSAAAHVNLISPDGGESLEAGTVFTIHWEVAIAHNTQNWDLWYSTESPDGPWTVVAEDIPAGDTSGGAQHIFDWTIPASASDTVWVQVRQDNNGTDYYDVSEGAFEITAPPCAGDVDGSGDVAFGDILNLIQAWGACAGCPQDVNGDGVVDFADVLFVITAWGDCL